MCTNRSNTVAVAHANAVIDAGLRYILAAQPDFQLQPPGGFAAWDADSSPDLLVTDHASGVRWVTSQVRAEPPRSGVLVVAIGSEAPDVRAAIEAGVQGYVVLDCSAEEVARAAKAVAQGRHYLCSAATLRMADSLAQPLLTLRESEVLALVSRGHNNKEVARSLGIALGTVKAHMRGLLGKLGARCRTEALWVASQRGLIHRSAGPRPERIPPSGRPLSAGGCAAARAGGAREAGVPRTTASS